MNLAIRLLAPLLAPLLTIALVGLPCSGARGDARALDPVRHATCIRYYSLDGDVKPDLLRRAVSGLSTMEAEAKIALGPSGVSSKPKCRFVALELPVGTTWKDVEKSMRKVSPKIVELEWTAFQGKDRELPQILGYSGPECVVGMDNDMRWFDLDRGLARFFYVKGKLKGEDLRSRFKTLYKPFDAEELGEIVQERIEWKLAEPLEASAAKAAEKAIGKLPGVAKVKIDLEKRTLNVDVAHDGMQASVVSAADAGKAAEGVLGVGGFLADDVLDALATAKVTVESAK